MSSKSTATESTATYSTLQTETDSDTLSAIDSRQPGEAGFHNGRRGRFNAWFFTAFDRYIAHIGRTHKDAAFGDLEPGTIVEIGAGVGANFDYVPDGCRLVAIEPNLAMHPGLLQRAADRNIELEINTASAERMDLADGSVDDVLCSLVLCTVEDQDATLAEIRRVLRPGGRLRFVEHVAAPVWSPRRWLQHALRRPWSWVYEGCDVCRNTEEALGRAGFSEISINRRRWRRSLFIPVNTAIHGVAVN